jgi:nucleoside-diphosphate-sugar epimerase
VITVLGGQGFIGREVVKEARAQGMPVSAPERGEPLSGRSLGTVVYCVGVTGDFRQRPLDTVVAHVSLLETVLRSATYDAMVYLSSARVYGHRTGPAAREDEPIWVSPSDPDHLYNISKLMGESLVLSVGRSPRVVRLTHVYRDDRSENFLRSLIRDATGGRLLLQRSLDSDRDFVSVEDVARQILAVARSGRHRIYNIGSGRNTSNGELGRALAGLTGTALEVAADAPTVRSPPIDISRLQAETAFQPRLLLDELPRLVKQASEKRST